MRLRALDLASTDGFVLVVDDVTHEQADHISRVSTRLADEVHRWGGRGVLVFADQVELDDVLDTEAGRRILALLDPDAAPDGSASQVGPAESATLAALLARAGAP